MGDHISMKDSQFAQLAAMGSSVDELMRVALLIFSLKDQSEFEPMIASIHTLGQEVTTCDYVATIVVEEYKRLQNKCKTRSEDRFSDSGKLASTR